MRLIPRIALFLALGLLPLWIALVMLAVSTSTSFDQEHAAWTLFMVLFGACPVSLFLTSAGFAGFHLSTGGGARKAKMGFAVALAAVAIVVLVSVVVHYKNNRRETSDAELGARVLQFVESDASARRQAGGTPVYHVSSNYRIRNGQTVEYTVVIEGSARIHAVVDVNYDAEPPALRLACLTPIDETFNRCERSAQLMRVLDLARGLPSLRAAAGGDPFYELASERELRGGRFEYDVEARGLSTAHAVFRTTATPPGVQLACVTTKHPNSQAGFLSDPCTP
jgi:hypothetical protein